MLKKLNPLLVVFIAPIIIILGSIIFKMPILSNNKEVMLRVKPVNPQEWLPGNTVSLQYEISTWEHFNYMKQNKNYIILGAPKEENIQTGDTVYMILQRIGGGRWWTRYMITKNKPPKNEIFIKGKVNASYTTSDDPQDIDNITLHIIYGIEQYHIPEGKKPNINLTFNEAVGEALVNIDENGNAEVKKIYINGIPWP